MQLVKGAAQRQVPKHPHKPSSQALGARYLQRQNWRKAASLDRIQHVRCPAVPTTPVGVIHHRLGCGHVAYAEPQTLTVPTGPMTGGSWAHGGQVLSAGDPAPPADMLIVDEYPQPLSTIRPPLSTIRTRSYRPSSGHHAYAPRR